MPDTTEYITIQQVGNRFRWEIYQNTHLKAWGAWQDSEADVERELQTMRLTVNIQRYEAMA